MMPSRLITPNSTLEAPEISSGSSMSSIRQQLAIRIVGAVGGQLLAFAIPFLLVCFSLGSNFPPPVNHSHPAHALSSYFCLHTRAVANYAFILEFASRRLHRISNRSHLLPLRRTAMDALLQDELQTAKGLVATTDALAQKKIIGLYFSAHWCPPCREFTPLFAQVYDDIKEAGHEDLEVVYISYDRNVEQFSEYFGDMPWLALPFVKRELKSEIGKKFGVRGVPMLIFVSDQGEIIEADGRELIEDNATDIDAILKALRK